MVADIPNPSSPLRPHAWKNGAGMTRASRSRNGIDESTDAAASSALAPTSEPHPWGSSGAGRRDHQFRFALRRGQTAVCRRRSVPAAALRRSIRRPAATTAARRGRYHRAPP